MKTTKIIVFILMFFLGFSNNASGQVLTDEGNQSLQELYDFHTSKKKINKTAAWITLGGGVAMIIGGFGWNSSTGFDGDTTNNSDGLWLSYLGGASTLVSIPLFIAAGKHKKKAKVQIQNGAIGFNNLNYTGISISFSL
nr:hypothetical protein [uncultured Psychroserpens sp.]